MVYTESSPDIILRAATADDMRACGSSIAKIMHSGDVIVLSGPLGAGKTTFSQGIGMGLDVEGAVVSAMNCAASLLIRRPYISKRCLTKFVREFAFLRSATLSTAAPAA